MTCPDAATRQEAPAAAPVHIERRWPRKAIRASPTGSTPIRPSSRRRWTCSSAARPGTTWAWNAKCPRPAASSATGSATVPSSWCAVKTAISTCWRTAAPIAARRSAGRTPARWPISPARTTNGTMTWKAICRACRSGAARGRGMPRDFDPKQNGIRKLRSVNRGGSVCHLRRGRAQLRGLLRSGSAGGDRSHAAGQAARCWATAAS